LTRASRCLCIGAVVAAALVMPAALLAQPARADGAYVRADGYWGTLDACEFTGHGRTALGEYKTFVCSQSPDSSHIGEYELWYIPA
jgi:hypothetical protein